MKICRDCNFKGPENLFKKDRNWCKKCESEYKKAHNADPINKANIKAYKKAYNADPIIKAYKKTFRQNPINKANKKVYDADPVNIIKKKQTSSYKKALLEMNWGTKEEKEWALDVKTRDDYICLYCGDQYGNKEAHHQYSVKNYPELYLVLNNGITLCKPCHRIETNKLAAGEFI